MADNTERLTALLEKGFFPMELPPAFTSTSYAQAVVSCTELPAAFTNGRSVTELVRYRLARSGTLHRTLGIPNPVTFYGLAHEVVQSDAEVMPTPELPYSLTHPVFADDDSLRAVNRSHSFSAKAAARLRTRRCARYVLQADISRFYHAVYTHSIPWALHGKSESKMKPRDMSLLGNRLDALVRNAQGKQTMGIPVGPDTSLVLAELILRQVDKQLHEYEYTEWFRYMDDYEFAFKSLGEAEAALGRLQSLLSATELALNPSKTCIVKLPDNIEAGPVALLRSFSFRELPGNQKSDIVHYFNTAFTIAKTRPEVSILKYAVSRLGGVDIHQDNWESVQQLYMQCCTIEPGVIPAALRQLVYYSKKHEYSIAAEDWTHVVNSVIGFHAPQGHSSEVAWGLWLAWILNLAIKEANARSVAEMLDDIPLILLLALNKKGLVYGTGIFDTPRRLLTHPQLIGQNWLFSYEAQVKEWLRSYETDDHIREVDAFLYLRDREVSFFDENYEYDIDALEESLKAPSREGEHPDYPDSRGTESSPDEFAATDAGILFDTD